MKTMTTLAIAVALGAAWTVTPALASSTTDRVENKAERAADKIEDKAERAADKIEDKAERAKDRADGKDTMGEKLDRAVDKTKAKTRELKNKVAVKADRGDVRNAQQALMAKGHNPGPIDGVMGPRTRAAVSEFQAKEGLKVTGSIDGETRARLMGSASTSDGAPGSPAASPATAPAAPATQKQAGGGTN